MNEGILGATSESPEIIEKFKERGHPLGRTNVVKQTWNKLWVEKKAGNLIHLPKLGYWLPNEPLSEEDKAKAAAARAERLKASRKGPRKQPIRKGNPRGRKPTLSYEQLAIAEEWVLEGLSKAEIARRLGVDPSVVRYHFPDGTEGVMRRRSIPVELLTDREARRELARLMLLHNEEDRTGKTGEDGQERLVRLGQINLRLRESETS